MEQEQKIDWDKFLTRLYYREKNKRILEQKKYPDPFDGLLDLSKEQLDSKFKTDAKFRAFVLNNI